ncbi:MAG: glycosyltransferase [bacterium]
MRIVLDLQACQTESRFRGMGRYSMSLAKAIAKNANNNHEIWLFLNNLFPDTIPYISQSFKGLIPKERIFVFSAHGPVAEVDPQNEWRARASELIREYALSQLKPDVVHISSLFEAYGDDAVTSIGKLDSKILTAVTLYDLIPHVNPEACLPNKQMKKWYYRKIQSFKNSNFFLSISEYSKKEAIDNLGIAQENIVNISAAVDENFKPVVYSEEQRNSILSRYNISKPFIMYSPGGFEERKNIKKLIEAYSLISPNIKKEHQLIITGKINGEIKNDLNVYAKKFSIDNRDLIFTGYVQDDDLIALYNICKLFVCPSLHEGFGLPPLEAMACGAPAIGSNCTSIPEVIGRQDALFDPFSAESISDKISEVLTHEGFLNSLKEHALKQAKKFSWDESAKKSVESFEIILQINNSKKITTIKRKTACKPRLAFLSPLPPEMSGISNYSKELLPELALYYDITLIVDQPIVEGVRLNTNFPIHDILWFKANVKKFERILYQFGNSPFHKHMFLLLKKYPGAVVLHDFYLSNAINWMEISGYAPDFFKQSLYYSHGYNALIFLNENGTDKTRFAYPMNKEILDSSMGVIVHSQYSIEKAKEWYGLNSTYNFSHIPQLRGLAKVMYCKDIIDIRVTLGFSKDDFVICSFGFLDETKLNHILLKVFLNSSLCKCKNCHLVFVGENHGGDYGKNMLEIIKNSGLEENIKITGFVDENIYRQYLSICDVAVQLRSLSRGETSRAVLDTLAYGLPLIINAHGPMAEYPEDILIKLSDEFNDNDLIKAIEKLKNNPELREKLSIAGRKYISEQHNPKKIADDYFNAVENFYSNSRYVEYKNLINSLSNIDTNVQPSNIDIVSLSEAIANCSFKTSQKQLFIDISTLVGCDLKTGIERVTKAIMLELLQNPPDGFRTEPVFFDGHHYRYARKFIFEFLSIGQCEINDEVINIGRNDIFLGTKLNFEHLKKEAATSGIMWATKFTIDDLQAWPNKNNDKNISLNFIDQFPKLKCILNKHIISLQHTSINDNGAEKREKLVDIANTGIFKKQYKKILLIKLDHMGDFILAIPAIMKLKNRYPYSQIDIIAGSWNEPIAKSINIFNNIYKFDYFKKESWKLPDYQQSEIKELLEKLDYYDIGIDLRVGGDTRFLLKEINADLKIGYQSHSKYIDSSIDILLPYEGRVPKYINMTNDKSISKQILSLIDSIPSDDNDFIVLPDFLDRTKININDLQIAVFPIAGNSIKEWGENNFIDLIDSLCKDNRINNINVYFPNSKESKRFVFREHKKINIHVGLSFNDLVKSLSHNLISIANNSFGAHISSYIGLITFAIFSGHETVIEWGPAFGNSSYVIHSNMDCSPCYIGKNEDCKNNLKCIANISPDYVYGKITNELENIMCKETFKI